MAEAKATAKPQEKAEPLHNLKSMQTMAREYMVPMHDDALKQVAQDMTPEKGKAFEEYIKDMAQGLYPTLAPQIKGGMKTMHLVEPYRQVAKQILGSQFEPDFVSDPKSMKALTGQVDEKTGRPAPMGLDQWRQHLMTERSFGWEYTPAAHEAAQKVIQHINEGFSNPPATPQGAR
jgi:hypothetical protein